MSLRILVTGGAGFIGSRTVLRLLEEGHEVTVYDNLAPQIHGADPSTSFTLGLLRGKCELVRASVNDAEALAGAVKGKDAVLHLAAETGTGQSMYQVSHYVETNVGGTAHLAEAILTAGQSVGRVVLASSRSIYGEGAYRCATHGVVYPKQRLAEDLSEGRFELRCPVCGQFAVVAPTTEDAAVNPLSVYAATKLQQEHLLRTALSQHDSALVTLRYQNVYGPGQSLRNPYTGILSIFSGAIIAGKRVSIFEDGLESRDFVYIDDVAEANVRALVRPVQADVEINIGMGLATSVLDVYKGVARALGKAEDFTMSGEYRIGDIRHCFADVSEMRKTLDFSATVSFAEGTRRVAEWATARMAIEGDEGAGYERSIAELRRRNLLKR